MTLSNQNLLRKVLLIVAMAGAISAVWSTLPKAVVDFSDSASVADSIIVLGNIAQIECSDPFLLARLRALKVGESAPPGYARFIVADECFRRFIDRSFTGLVRVNNPACRVVVSTKSSTHHLSEISDSLINNISDQLSWPEGCAKIFIRNLDESWKTLPSAFTWTLNGLIDPLSKGPIALKLLIKQGSIITSVPVIASIKVTTPVAVAVTTICRNEKISMGQYRMEPRDITVFSGHPVTSGADLSNRLSRQTIAAGTIVQERMLKPIPLVQKGQIVQIEVRNNSVAIAMNGIARESGDAGQMIWVENTVTHKLLKTTIVSKTKVEL